MEPIKQLFWEMTETTVVFTVVPRYRAPACLSVDLLSQPCLVDLLTADLPQIEYEFEVFMLLSVERVLYIIKLLFQGNLPRSLHIFLSS